MNHFQKFFSTALVLAVSPFAQSAMMTTQLVDATNGGGFFGEVTFTDVSANKVNITADISNPINVGLTKGDILGLWFDFADFNALSGLPSISNENPTGIVENTFFGENSIDASLGGNANLNGAGETNWDFAVETGSNGGPDFIQTLSFDLMITGLDATQFFNQRVGMRVQSIEGVQDFREGSSKLIGDGTTVTVPEPGTIALLGLGLLSLSLTRRKH